MINYDKQYYKRSFILSCVIHGVLIGLLLINFKAGSPSLPSQKMTEKMALSSVSSPKEEIVQATVIDEKAVIAEIKRQESQEKQQKEEIKQAAIAKKEREKEQVKITQLKKELARAKQEEETRLAEIKLAREKELKQLEALKKEKEKEQKRLEALDERRQEEQDRANHVRQQREAEEKKLKAAEAKQKADDAKKRSVERAQEQAEEGERLNAEHKNWVNSELARFQGLFRDKVNQSWIRAPGLPEGLVCVLEIRLLPDGTVSGVKVSNSSGNYAFDQAAEAAVQKASPLPVPKEAELMEKFRHFTFEFRPPEAT